MTTLHPTALAVFVAFVRLNPQVSAMDPAWGRTLSALQVLALELDPAEVPQTFTPEAGALP